MFELFLVMLALTSPILIIIFVRNYFNYKSEVNQKIVIVLEKIVTDSKFELGQEISQL